MEILYLWIKSYKGISNLGINLSNQYTFDFEETTKTLNVTENSDFEKGFWGDQITNLTAIVGRNGVGKTSIIEFIIELISTSETTENILVYESEKVLYYQSSKVLFSNNNIIKNDNLLTNMDISLVYLSNIFNPTSENKIDYSMYLINITTNFLLKNDILKSTDKLYNFKNFVANDFRNIIKLIELGNKDIFSALPKVLNLKIKRFPMRVIDNQSEMLNKLILAVNTLNESISNLFKREAISELEHFIINVFKQSLKFKINSDELDKLDIKLLYSEIIKINELVEHINRIDSLEEIHQSWLLYFIQELETLHLDSSYLKPITNGTLRKIYNSLNFNDISYSIDLNKQIFSIDIEEKSSNIIKQILNVFFDSDSELEQTIRLYISHRHGDKEDTSISSGEYSMLILLGRLNSILDNENAKSKTILLLIDEAELGLHPQWQKNFISNLLDFINKRFVKHNLQIVLTSHSPFILSDIPKHCVILLDKNESNVVVTKGLAKSHNTFGTNIHELFTDSFFLQDGLMGEFSRKKINELINSINKAGKDIDFESYQKKINIIGEPFLRNKITELLLSKTENKNRHIDFLIKKRQEEIEELERQKRKKEDD